jgi:nucleoside-diphosphate-sugar epimerase
MSMTILIFGTNGMLSSYLSTYFHKKDSGNIINLLGIEEPKDYFFSYFKQIDLLKDEIDYTLLRQADLIIYAAGAGIQSALNTDTDLMYCLNLYVPIDLCNTLKKLNYTGFYISFGSYMEIGLNEDENQVFDEKQIELSDLPATNDYALSKRLLTRFMGNLKTPFSFWHFILPNTFIKDETGTRLIPYVLEYLNKTKKGETCDVPRFSSGDQIRQYVNFEDVCISISKCLELGIPSGIYNIGGGEILSVRELIIRLFNHFQLPLSDEMFGKDTRRDVGIRSLKLNGEKIRREIGYLPDQLIESIL